MIKVSDYIANFLAQRGIRHVFLLTGGGAMHLNDSLGNHPALSYICQHHEQACAMAGEAYSKVTGGMAVINVTSGPGGINALNGVFGAWTDSVPMLVLSGQVKRETCLGATEHLPGLRQIGEQEVDIVRMVAGITKYAVLVADPLSIRYHLEKAWHLALNGRRGPCWLDIPVDVQGAMVPEKELAGFPPPETEPDRPAIRSRCEEVLARIRVAQRPMILAGSGIRCADAVERFERVIGKLGIPVALSRSAHDLLAPADPLFAGWPGIDCARSGNLNVQNADLLLVLGSRLGIRLVSYNWNAFARHAYKIQVDIDRAEMEKPTIRPDLAIESDLGVFLEELERVIPAGEAERPGRAGWIVWCRERLRRYPGVLPHHREFNGRVNPYHFCDVLFQNLRSDDCIVCADGTAYQVPLQVGIIQKGQRMIFNNGCMSMGYELPGAIGAAVARGGQRVICMAGDGSIQLNIQEMQTIVHHRLPVKIFVFANNGYLSIRLTQQAFFGRCTGESRASGVSFPDLAALANAYGMAARRICGPDVESDIRAVLETPGPVLAEIATDPAQPFEPKVASKRLPDGRMVSAPPEDMFPFLDREELAQNLLFPPEEREQF